jgi:hypothetical protein
MKLRCVSLPLKSVARGSALAPQTRRETDAMLDKLAQSRLDAVQQVRAGGGGGGGINTSGQAGHAARRLVMAVARLFCA